MGEKGLDLTLTGDDNALPGSSMHDQIKSDRKKHGKVEDKKEVRWRKEREDCFIR